MRDGLMNRSISGASDTTADVLTIKEAAIFLRCSKAHVQNLLAGKLKGSAPLPCVPLGRRKLIRRESLLRWIERAEGLHE
jgi:excisionase family DNA binding protein